MVIKDNYVQFENLHNNEVMHFYTTSNDNFNLNFIDREDAIKKVFSFCLKNDFDVERIVYPHQQHTTNIAIVTEDNINDAFNNIDGLITKIKNLALVSYSADCQTILLYDPIKRIIGNIHSGWQGTLDGIVSEAIKKFKELGSVEADIEVYICPSIHKCCFEVDEDIVLKFKNKYDDIDEFISLGKIKEGKQKYYVDTIKINEKILNKLGVNKFYSSGLCTKCNTKFHSYRREKSSERNMGMIMLKNVKKE